MRGAAGEKGQANGGHGQRPAEPLELLVGREPLAPLLLVLLHETARLAAVRPQAPSFREVEHLAHDFEDPVRLVRLGPVLVVQRRDVLAFDFVDGELAELGQHELLHQPAAAFVELVWISNHFNPIPH